MLTNILYELSDIYFSGSIFLLHQKGLKELQYFLVLLLRGWNSLPGACSDLDLIKRLKNIKSTLFLHFARLVLDTQYKTKVRMMWACIYWFFKTFSKHHLNEKLGEILHSVNIIFILKLNGEYGFYYKSWLSPKH